MNGFDLIVAKRSDLVNVGERVKVLILSRSGFSCLDVQVA